MYPVARGFHHGRDQRSRNVVVEQSGENAAPPSLWCLGEILLMARDSHEQYLAMLVFWLETVLYANTYPHVGA